MPFYWQTVAPMSGFRCQVSGVRIKGETRWPKAIIWTWRIWRSIKSCVGYIFVEWIRENIGAKNTSTRTPLAVSWGNGSVWRNWWIVPSGWISPDTWNLTPETWHLYADTWNQIAMAILANNSLDLHPFNISEIIHEWSKKKAPSPHGNRGGIRVTV